VSEYRAILVSQEERDDLESSHTMIGDDLLPRWEAAGDQPRIRVCVNPSHARPNGWPRPVIDERCFAYRADDPCRVEDAIVLVVPRSS
jgi:hypothetical protein